MADHAKLSPSAADRWANCTKAPEVEQGYEEQTSTYAQEGTEAHELLERAILAQVPPSKLEPDHPAALHADVAFTHVAPSLKNPKHVVLTETQVQLTEDCWGTADMIIMRPNGELEIADYKHGRGILVEADCLQLLIYGVAAYRSLAFMAPKPIKSIVCTLVQPRAAHSDGPVRSEEYTIEAALDAIEKVEGAIKRIKNGETAFCPTTKGCRWCKHKANCPALAEAALQEMHSHFTPLGDVHVPTTGEAAALTMEQKVKVLQARDLFNMFLGTIEKEVEETLSTGQPVPGVKLVAGRSNRKWFTNDDDEVLKRLTGELKLKKGDITQTKLLGPASIEKIIAKMKRGKKQKEDALKELIVKPEGKPVVAPESDKRPAIGGHFTNMGADPLN